MTALQAPTRPTVSLPAGLGWCVPCAAAGQQRPAADPRAGSACRDHLRLLPRRPVLPGQPVLFDAKAVSRLLQAAHPTGVRVACSPCAAAGRDELGLPYRIADDPTPLCLACWRRQERQAGRRGTAAAEPIEWVEDLPTGCPACDSPDPVPGCWLCGYSWLADARTEHERLVEAEQAAIDAEFERLAAREAAAARVAWLTGWVSRLRDVLAAYADADRRGNVVSPRWGRAVELLADALARDVAERGAGPGRPSVYRMVAAVMAVDADFRTGRRAMPGRAQCAELAGVSERAVSNAWKRGVAIGVWIRTVQGRRLTLDERMDSGRGNDRAVYDLRPVHRSDDPAARDRMVPAALQALDELLGWNMHLLAEAERALDAIDSPTVGIGRAPSADVLTVRTQRARLRQVVATTRNAATVFAGHLEAGNTCTPHTVSKGECVSSCLRGLSFTFVDRAQVSGRRRPLRGRGQSELRASRSPAKAGPADLGWCRSVVDQPDGTPPATRPRTTRAAGGTSHSRRPERVAKSGPGRKARRRPEWSEWAYPLAHQLRALWPWLRNEPMHLVAATLGARLGPRWTAPAVVDFINQIRGGRDLPVVKHTPVGLLRELLEEALTGEVQPPYPARRHTEHQEQLLAQRRAASVAAAATRRAATAAARAAHETRPGGGEGLAAFRAARARLGHQASPRTVYSPAAADTADVDWPTPTAPGEGSPRPAK